MKRLRLTALAAVAALLTIAAIGAGSALGAETTLCKSSADDPFCSSGEGYPAGTALQAKASNVKIETTLMPITCASSSLTAETMDEAGSEVGVKITSWTFGKCKNFCTVKASEPEEDSTLSRVFGTNGDLKHLPSLTAECSPWWGYECTFTLNSALRLNGGAPASLSAVAAPMTVGQGPWCPENPASFTANYEVTSPKPLYVLRPHSEKPTKPETRLCKTSEWYCPTSDAYPSGTVINAEAPNIKIATTSGDINCGKSTLSAETEALGADPLPLGATKFTLKECYFSGVGDCFTSATESTGSIAALEPGWESNGRFQYDGTWTLECGPYIPVSTANSVKCVFDFQGAPALGTGETYEPWLEYASIQLHRLAGSNALCPEASYLTAKYTVTNPTPLYFAD